MRRGRLLSSAALAMVWAATVSVLLADGAGAQAVMGGTIRNTPWYEHLSTWEVLALASAVAGVVSLAVLALGLVWRRLSLRRSVPTA